MPTNMQRVYAMMKFCKRALAFTLALGFLLGLGSGLLPKTRAAVALPPMTPDNSAQEWEVLRQVNLRRDEEGLQPLTMIEPLQNAMDIRAEELLIRYDHERPDGSSCFTVLEEVGLTSLQPTGENIAAGYPTAAAVMDGWMNSPGHRANILKQNATHVGVGYDFTSGGYGSYWVQMFCTSKDCRYTDFQLILPTVTFEPGTGLEEMGLIGVLNCAHCGTSYLPILSSYCTGFDPAATGTQTATATCFDRTAQFQVTGGGAVQEVDPEDAWNPYRDVPKGQWYYDGVKFVTEQGLFQGVEGGRFLPGGTMTRGMLVTVLYRLAGEPSVQGLENPFYDVSLNRYYGAPVLWASANGLVEGHGNGKFTPEGNVTRQDMAVILYRYAQKMGYDTTPVGDLTAFPDADRVSGYAADPMRWAVGNGIINGVKNGQTNTLSPRAYSTRAQVAVVLQRFVEKIVEDPV